MVCKVVIKYYNIPSRKAKHQEVDTRRLGILLELDRFNNEQYWFYKLIQRWMSTGLTRGSHFPLGTYGILVLKDMTKIVTGYLLLALTLLANMKSLFQ